MERISPLFRKIYLLMLLMVCSYFTHAQMTDGGPRIGLKVGIGGANLYDDVNAKDKKARTAFTGGVFAKIPVTKGGKIAIRPELLLTLKGGKYNFNTNTSEDFRLTYLELPASLEFRLLGFFNVHAGLHAGYLIGGSGKVTISGANQTISIDDLEKLDYGYQVGGGIDLGNIGLHLRVSRGLKEVGKKESVNQFVGNLKNASWALTLSLGLNN